MNKLARFIIRHTSGILWLSLILTLGGGYFTFRLYSNLRTDLEELLPATSRSVRDLDQVARRLRSIDNLALIIYSKDTHASKRFVNDLAGELKKFPKEEVAGIEYRIDRELEFFKKRQLLYVDRTQLKEIRDYIEKKVDYETALYNPLNIFSEQRLNEPTLDLRAMQEQYADRAKDYSHFPGGFFSTPDETKRAILINASGKSLGINGVKQLKKRVVDTISKLNPSSYAKDLQVHYTGSVEEMMEEQEALVEDLAVSTVAVMVLVSVAMFGFFKLFWPTVCLLVSLVGGTIWTFGFSYFAVGYLNANSAFLGSIVLGNGINFGIILLARYLEERRGGRLHVRACYIAITTTWKATLTAAMGAGLSYGSLMMTSFRGFNQFGVIGLIGMAACWICTYTLLPALLTLSDRLAPTSTKALRKQRGAPLAGFAAWTVSHFPKAIAGLSVLFTVLSVISMSRANSGLLETNLKNLRSKTSDISGAAFYDHDLNEIFHRFLTPVVILPTTRKNALEIAQKLKDLKKKQGPTSSLISVQTIDDFVPTEQLEKLRLMEDIRYTLKPKLVRRLDEKDRQQATQLLSPEAFRQMDSLDLPDLIRDKFTERDGSVGKLVVVEPPITKEIWMGANLENFIEELRSVADSVEPGAAVAGGMAITSDLVTSISRDGPKATLLAFISVVVLVIALYRDYRIFFPALFSLIVGVSWFGGLIVELEPYGLKINFLNFVALPITFGIGIDYGINVFHRYHQQLDHDIVRVIRETGGAVGLCSLTTIIGYSSLLMASNRGFVSFGLLAVLGELTCAVAALLSLPAVLVLWNRSRETKVA
jgi:predicted RND superfamily exporter protein